MTTQQRWQKTFTEEYMYKMGNISEMNYTKEVPEGIFPIGFTLIDQHQHKYPSLK